MTDFLTMYTIYDSPADARGRFVVRKWRVDHMAGEPIDLGITAIVSTLDDARATIPPWLFCLSREPGDEHQIVETWL